MGSKKTMTILLLVLFVASLTATTVGAGFDSGENATCYIGGGGGSGGDGGDVVNSGAL